MRTDEWLLTAVDVPRAAIEPVRVALSGSGFVIDEVAELHRVDIPARTVVIVADGDQLWVRLDIVRATGAAGAVALMDDCDLNKWSGTLGLGATPVRNGCSPQTLVEVVRACTRDQVLLPVELVRHMVDTARSASFTSLDDELIELLADRVSIAEIAVTVGWSERTVRRRLRSLYAKLGVTSYREAATVAHARTSSFHA